MTVKCIITRASLSPELQPCPQAQLDAQPIVVQKTPHKDLDAATIGLMLARFGGLLQVTQKATYELQYPWRNLVWYVEFEDLAELLAFVRTQGKVVLYPDPVVYLDNDATNPIPYRDYPFGIIIYDYYLE